MLSGQVPFNGKDNQEIQEKILKGKFNFDHPSWTDVSEEAKSFVSRLLTYDESNRPSAILALKDNWIIKHCTIHLNH